MLLFSILISIAFFVFIKWINHESRDADHRRMVRFTEEDEKKLRNLLKLNYLKEGDKLLTVGFI